ncbi:MAG: hypothetical protein MAG795_00545 [Candidatus Woesearchaeota archaeon]|nr:hypothetical protein [Candidatus Woesearchaeota archaeon]
MCQINEKIYRKLIDKLKGRDLNKEEIAKIKYSVIRNFKAAKIPSDFDIVLRANAKERKQLKSLITKPTRTISGVAVVAIMTKPSKCPHGKCICCPGGKDSGFGDVPQSYTGREPATMRGIRNNYDPYLQIFNRLEQYTVLGHDPSKVEMIIMGGTFTACTKKYQKEFVSYSFKAFNDFSKLFFDPELKFDKFKDFFELPGKIGSKKRVENIHNKLLKLKGEFSPQVLEQEQVKNENAKIRCVALCIETRPDYCKEQHIDQMLKLGTTRIELGVQSLYDNSLEKINRGHTVKESIIATKLAKDSLLKVGYHMMPGLPLSDPDKDLEMLKRIFSDSDFKPDALKIYPCMVMPGTKLYKDYNKGNFVPMDTKTAANLIADFKQYVPKYCRIMRVQRDIPTKVTSAGVDMTNLRQEVHKIMNKKGIKCSCIRCREPRKKKINLDNLKIKRMEYGASKGKEIFISAETKKALLGFCRLRIPAKPFRKEITKDSAGIRELHVYGVATSLHKKGAVQHRGIGKKLMTEVEKIALDFDKKKMVVISGVGVRGYYRKLGYQRQGRYMVKKL